VLLLLLLQRIDQSDAKWRNVNQRRSQLLQLPAAAASIYMEEEEEGECSMPR
jgi:hypothetical protein